MLRVAGPTAIGGLTGNVSGAAGAAAGTLTAPAVADALKTAGVDGDLAKGLIALASTAAGVAAAGGSAGGVTALNEVTNNHLNHLRPYSLSLRLSEKERYEAAVAACAQQDAAACTRAQELRALSTARDQALAKACGPQGNSLQCGTFIKQAQDMGNVVDAQPLGGLTFANSPEQGLIRGLNTAVIKPYESAWAKANREAHEWQAQAGTPAVTMLSGGVGLLARGVLLLEGVKELGKGVAQTSNGDYADASLSFFNGMLGVTGAVAGQESIKAPAEASTPRTSGNLLQRGEDVVVSKLEPLEVPRAAPVMDQIFILKVMRLFENVNALVDSDVLIKEFFNFLASSGSFVKFMRRMAQRNSVVFDEEYCLFPDPWEEPGQIKIGAFD